MANDWIGKEEAYDEMYRRGRISTNLWKYIPAKVLPGVIGAYSDSDGYWIYLDREINGWVAYDGDSDCGVIHEYTIADLRSAIKTIRRVK